MINEMSFYFCGTVLQWFIIAVDVFSASTFEVPIGEKLEAFCFPESGALAQAYDFSYLH